MLARAYDFHSFHICGVIGGTNTMIGRQACILNWLYSHSVLKDPVMVG